jgi:hypothetical protein
MIINYQKDLIIKNTCDALFSETDLINAILWYTNKPVYKNKHIFIHSKYPAVNIYYEKIHIHRLLMMYWLKSDIPDDKYVHHIDGNKLNSLKNNLKLIDARTHQSIHNKNKKLSNEHRLKISESNRRRKGMEIKKRVEMPELKALIKNGWSINRIAQHYGCAWSTVRDRIYQNPKLLEVQA